MSEDQVFSRKCSTCGKRTVALAPVSYSTPFDHDGRKHTVTIDGLVVPQCGNCQTIVLGDEANRQIDAAFRNEAFSWCVGRVSGYNLNRLPEKALLTMARSRIDSHRKWFLETVHNGSFDLSALPHRADRGGTDPAPMSRLR